MEPIITKHSGNWTSGHIGPFRFEVKHYEEPSVFGIDEGRISKLWLARAYLVSRISKRVFPPVKGLLRSSISKRRFMACACS